VAQGLIVGQPTALLACAVSECYVSLRAGHDLRAGLWLSVLLFKPQYGVLIGPILIWKRRWLTVVGTALGALAMLLASVVLVRPSGGGFLWALGEYGAFGGGALIAPGLMINWRALILWLRPSIGSTSGLLLLAVLSLLTLVLVLPIWRGRWASR